MRHLLLAALGLALLCAGPARAQSGLAATAAAAVPSLERAAGMPIVVLQRTGDDPGQFWYAAMQALCAKTGENWCETDVSGVLTDTTNLMGWSRVLTYTPGMNGASGSISSGGGGSKSVCVILPPMPGISPGFAALGLAGGGGPYGYRELPTGDEAEAYLYFVHAGNCLATGDAGFDQKRADAFAALSLTLIEGSPAFLSPTDVSPSRKLAAFRDPDAAGWAVSVGERILLDLWKPQTASALQAQGCSAAAQPGTSIDTQSIPKDPALPPGQDCSGSPASGQVTDSNLGLWAAKVGMPPVAYTPFMTFDSVDAGIAYTWTTADSIARQR